MPRRHLCPTRRRQPPPPLPSTRAARPTSSTSPAPTSGEFRSALASPATDPAGNRSSTPPGDRSGRQPHEHAAPAVDPGRSPPCTPAAGSAPPLRPLCTQRLPMHSRLHSNEGGRPYTSSAETCCSFVVQIGQRASLCVVRGACVCGVHSKWFTVAKVQSAASIPCSAAQLSSVKALHCRLPLSRLHNTPGVRLPSPS